MLKENTLADVRYEKGDEVTDRQIVVTFVPAPKHQNVKGIDVTGLNNTETSELLERWQEYQTYLNNQRKTLFAFDEFIEHSGGTPPEIKWRTFKPAQLNVLG